MNYHLDHLDERQLLAVARGLEHFDVLASLSMTLDEHAHERVDGDFERKAERLYRAIIEHLVGIALGRSVDSLYLTDECGGNAQTIRDVETFRENWDGQFYTLRCTHAHESGVEALASALRWLDNIKALPTAAADPGEELGELRRAAQYVKAAAHGNMRAPLYAFSDQARGLARY